MRFVDRRCRAAPHARFQPRKRPSVRRRRRGDNRSSHSTGTTNMALWKDTPAHDAASAAAPISPSAQPRRRETSATTSHSAVRPATSATTTFAPRSKKVFIVHGHDDVAKTQLELFLHEIGLEPIVLHRQADEGLTIIEKFEKHSDVGYAFVLLTPDEIAYLAADEEKPDRERQKEARTRPNVIFEFGYFVGKLGRSRVCCLHTGTVSLPSDVSGVIYKRYERRIDEVAYSILKELKASGYDLK